MEFVIPGIPVEWARARRDGNRYFTAKKQAVKKEVSLVVISENMRRTGTSAFEKNVPLRVELTFVFNRPQRQLGTGRNAGRTKKTAPAHLVYKPDIDNLEKFVLDVCNNEVWHDDCQVVSLSAIKRYARDGESAHTEVRILPV